MRVCYFQFLTNMHLPLIWLLTIKWCGITDCRPTCPDGYTYTPPGAASCGCVIAMHAQLRLGIKLESLFPLVSELAKELAEGLFLQISQVRIVGANAADQSQDKTDVNADIVPLDTFDNTTAQLLSSRLWSGQVQLNTTLFGAYSVKYVKYPGTCPKPCSSLINFDTC
jgi:hypothetical protein